MTRSSYTTNYTISYLNLYNKKILNIKKHITIFILHNTQKKNVLRSILIVSTIIYIKKLNKILYPTYIYCASGKAVDNWQTRNIGQRSVDTKLRKQGELRKNQTARYKRSWSIVLQEAWCCMKFQSRPRLDNSPTSRSEFPSRRVSR